MKKMFTTGKSMVHTLISSTFILYFVEEGYL